MKRFLKIIAILLLLGIIAPSCSTSFDRPTTPNEVVINNLFTTPKHYSSFKWHPLTTETVMNAAIDDKIIILFFYKEDCGPCEMMKSITFVDECVTDKIKDDFLFVFINVDYQSNITKKILSNKTVPSTGFIHPNLGPLPFTISGYMAPTPYCDLLELISQIFNYLH